MTKIEKKLLEMVEISMYIPGYVDENTGIIYIVNPDLDVDTIFFRDEIYIRMWTKDAVVDKSEEQLHAYKKIKPKGD